MSDTQSVSGNGAPAKSQPDDEKITVRIPAALLSRIDHAALGNGVRRSEFVRQALATHADAVLGKSPDCGGPTLYDVLAADGVIGRFAGPLGLSAANRTAIQERMRKRLTTSVGTGRAGSTREPQQLGRENVDETQ